MMRSSSFITLCLLGAANIIRAAQPYWLEEIKHQGISAFNIDPSSYQVFRNVKDFGAIGDGITDDTAAIQNAMSSGGRCGDGCKSDTTTPAVVYFPAGTYLLSTSIKDDYYTQIIGNPNNLPILKAAPNFSGFGLIDGNPYGGNGIRFGPTNVFYRTIRNLIFDLTDVPSSSDTTALHWPTSQATSLQNLVFRLSDAPDTQHTGLFIEDGSGGFVTDLVFYGGKYAANMGNQQFTMRNLTFNNAVQAAIHQIWDWTWTYQGLNINNCSVGLIMDTGGHEGQSVGSITIIDSTFTNTPVAVVTAHNSTSLPPTGGSLIIENVVLNNVSVAVQGPSGVLLPGGTLTIAAWGQGHEYTPNGPVDFQSAFTPFPRPQSLTIRGKYYARSKPQYEKTPLTSFVSVRTAGAKGDGVADDTLIINNVLASAAASKLVVFFDAGTYKVTDTIFVPPGSRIVGESYSVIMGAGAFFSQITKPQPVVSVGQSGQFGIVEWSDMIVSTQGATAGAILIQWNLASSEGSPSGMWDVHTRIGGFAGSNLQLAQCPTAVASNTTGIINPNCIAAFMSMYIAPSTTGLYMENTWFWVADHDIEDQVGLRQITIYAGRGLYSASLTGTIWLVGTSVEHHDLYQYQFANTKNTYMGIIQSETAYWQPNPKAGVVTPMVEGWNDPDFVKSCAGVSGNCAAGWGLRVVESKSILVYGAGLYSFFQNNNASCSGNAFGGICQTRIVSIEGKSSKNVVLYNLNTVASAQMVVKDGTSLAAFLDNKNAYEATIAYFKSN